MSNENGNSKSDVKKNLLPAGAAGSGLTTFLALILNAAIPNEQIKEIIYYALPSIAVILSGIVLFLKKIIIDPAVLKWKKKTDLKNFKILSEYYSKVNKIISNDPNIPDDFKKMVSKYSVDELDNLLKKYSD